MKNFIKFLFILVITLPQCNYSQGSILNTTSDYNDKVTSDDRTTIINLFDIEYNGEKIPINLIYAHSGVRIKQDYGELGYGWKLQDIGFIENVVNGSLDYETGKGWFSNPANPSYLNNEIIQNDCLNVFSEESGQNDLICAPTTFQDGDLSPDYYSVSTATGLNFDFLFQGVQDYPSILSNSQDSRVEIFPLNFQSDITSTNTGVVFNITDNKGNNHNFISGPKINEANRLSEGGSYRNNFYLQSLTNPSTHNDFVNIEYRELGTYLPNYDNFYTGINIFDTSNPTSTQSQDYNNNIINNQFIVDTFLDNRKNAIDKITTKNRIIQFEYNIDRLLEKIHINDINGNNINSYEFAYIPAGTTQLYLLQSITKVNYAQSFSQTLHQFEYFNDIDPTPFIDLDYGFDYYGYFNNSAATANKFPFQVRIDSSTILSPANLNPNLFYAKQLSLKKITNKFGGVIDFDYSLNIGTCVGENVSMFYGGGLVLDSKKFTPNIGKKKKIQYMYEDLNGYVVNTSNPKNNYVKEANNKKFWTNRFEQINTETLVPNDSTFISHSAIRGNFFKKIIIKEYDFDTMSLESQKILRFIPDYEGINFSPKIKNETLYDSSFQIVNETEHSYNNMNFEEIASARVNIITNLTSSFSGSYYAEKKYFPIYFNVSKLKNIVGKTINNSSTMINNTNYYYINGAGALNMTTSKTSQGELFKTVYTYPDPNDISISNEPFVTELNQYNIVTPLKVEKFLDNTKLFEEKIVFDSPSLGMILPKYIYAKKETGSNVLTKTKSYDVYDGAGNVLQYTEFESKTTSLIWGNNSRVIAKIENMQYANIPTSLINSIQTASDSGNESQLITAINTLRSDSSMQNSLITSYTYNIRLDVSSATDSKGLITYYNYNADGSLLNMKDSSGNLIMEKQNHFTN